MGLLWLVEGEGRGRERGWENNRREEFVFKVIYIIENVIYMDLNFWKDYFLKSSSCI